MTIPLEKWKQLKDEIARLRAELERSDIIGNNAHAEIRGKDAEISRLRTELASRDTRIAQLVEANDCIPEFEAELARLRARLEFSHDRLGQICLDSYAEENQRFSDEIGRLRAELATKNAELDDLSTDTLSKEVRNLRADLGVALNLVARAHPQMVAVGLFDWTVRADAALALAPRQTQPPESHASAIAKPGKNCTSA
jgi:DNA repair exonuclease SbcCD ATPase subunit